MDELKSLAKPLVEYLRQNHNPHTTIVITYDRVVVVQDLMGIPFPLDDQFVEPNKLQKNKVDNPLKTIQKAVENVRIELDGKAIAQSASEYICSKHKDTPDMSGIKTCDLVRELSTRDGVKQEIVEPYQDTEIKVSGPAIALVVID